MAIEGAFAIAETAEMVPNVAALESALARVWEFRDRESARNRAHEIVPGLWLGGCEAPPPTGLTHVVTLWNDDREDIPVWPVAEADWLVVRVRDAVDARIGAHFATCSAFLSAAFEADPTAVALVHCEMGRSRSAAVTIAFLMEHFRVPLRVAYAHVMLRRHVSALHDGFYAQLVDRELELVRAGRLFAPGAPTLPLLDYFCVTALHLMASRVATQRATSADVADAWIADGADSELERYVRGLRFVCEQTDVGRFSPHAREVSAQMAQLRMLRRVRKA